MPFIISKVDVSDAENIARYIQVPAMRTGPLYRMMFPRPDEMTEAQRNEVILWYADMIEDAVQDGRESLLKACSADGTLVGFCGWTTIERTRNCQVEADNCQPSQWAKQERRTKES
jgi:hypothetical protein